MFSSFASYIDILGTFSFAVSGAFAAMERKLDLFGILILSFVTAIGGGTIRDVLIGDLPVTWMKYPSIGWVILTGAIASLLFGRGLKKLQYLLNVFDAFGLGLFTLIGIQKGLQHHLSPGVCVALGTITGCFGGVIRDVLINKVPLIFQKEVYASLSILGGTLYLLIVSADISEPIASVTTVLFIFITRMFAIKYNWSLKWKT